MSDSPKIPTWLGRTANQLMELAEDLFAPGSAKKKQWVKDALKQALRAVDVPLVPDWLETPLENAILEVVIETIWSISFANRNKIGTRLTFRGLPYETEVAAVRE